MALMHSDMLEVCDVSIANGVARAEGWTPSEMAKWTCKDEFSNARRLLKTSVTKETFEERQASHPEQCKAEDGGQWSTRRTAKTN